MVRRNHFRPDERPVNRLSYSVVRRVRAQKRRQVALDAGHYELDEDEGFVCPECGWQSLTAELDIESEDVLSVCDECGERFHSDTSNADEKLEPWYRSTPDACTISAEELDELIAENRRRDRDRYGRYVANDSKTQ